MKVITNLYATAAICSFTYLITPNVAYAVQSCNYEVERAKIESIIDDNYRKLSEVRNLIFSKNLQGNQNLVRKYDGLIERILGNIEKEMKSMLSDS